MELDLLICEYFFVGHNKMSKEIVQKLQEVIKSLEEEPIETKEVVETKEVKEVKECPYVKSFKDLETIDNQTMYKMLLKMDKCPLKDVIDYDKVYQKLECKGKCPFQKELVSANDFGDLIGSILIVLVFVYLIGLIIKITKNCLTVQV